MAARERKELFFCSRNRKAIRPHEHRNVAGKAVGSDVARTARANSFRKAARCIPLSWQSG